MRKIFPVTVFTILGLICNSFNYVSAASQTNVIFERTSRDSESCYIESEEVMIKMLMRIESHQLTYDKAYISQIDYYASRHGIRYDLNDLLVDDKLITSECQIINRALSDQLKAQLVAYDEKRLELLKEKFDLQDNNFGDDALSESDLALEVKNLDDQIKDLQSLMDDLINLNLQYHLDFTSKDGAKASYIFRSGPNGIYEGLEAGIRLVLKPINYEKYKELIDELEKIYKDSSDYVENQKLYQPEKFRNFYDKYLLSKAIIDNPYDYELDYIAKHIIDFKEVISALELEKDQDLTDSDLKPVINDQEESKPDIEVDKSEDIKVVDDSQENNLDQGKDLTNKSVNTGLSQNIGFWLLASLVSISFLVFNRKLSL